MNSNKTQGFFLLLVFVWLGTFFLNAGFASEFNSLNLIRYCSMFGMIGIGVMFVIVTGGIDLSIGSTIGLIGASLVLLLRLNPIETLKPLSDSEQGKVVWFFWGLVGTMLVASIAWGALAAFQKNLRLRKLLFPGLFFGLAILSILALLVAHSDSGNAARIPCIFFLLFSISLFIGLLHGVLITRFELQPFVVTLGGLLCYRGLIRWLTDDSTQGLGSGFDESLRLLAKGEICTVATLMMFAGLATAIYGGIAYASQAKKTARTESSWSRMMALTTLGAIVGLIGSSRFWNGFERTNFEELFSFHWVIPVKFWTWDTIVSETAAARPQWLMQYSWIPLIPISLVLLYRMFATLKTERSVRPEAEVNLPGTESNRSDEFQLGWLPRDFIWMSETRLKVRTNAFLVSVIGLAVAATLLTFSYRLAQDQYQLNLSARLAWWFKTVAVFGSLAMVMISIARMGRWVERNGDAITRGLFPTAGLLAVLSVLGTTELPTTRVQTPFFLMIAVAAFAMVIFDKTVFGRYLLAIGNNEDAARFSGIDTEEVKVAAYVICSGIIGIAAMVFMLDSNSVAPSGFGSFYELYAIAAVVLGGCSLRGGEANIVGIIFGASIMRVLANAPDMIDFPKTLEYTILGLVIVVGVIVDDRIRKQAEHKALAMAHQSDSDS